MATVAVLRAACADRPPGRAEPDALAALLESPGETVSRERDAGDAWTSSSPEAPGHGSRRPFLIGGAIAKVGDLVFDGSLRTQLAQLRANLTKGSL